MIFDRYANLKYKYGRRNFRADNYSVSTVIKKEYIQKQLQEDDILYDQITMKEFIYSFPDKKRK